MLTAKIEELADVAAIDREILRRRRNKWAYMYPETGKYRRELYPSHTDFFKIGAEGRLRDDPPEKLFMAANQIGKSSAAAYELTCHLTGEYPAWWEGIRFTKPIESWAVNVTAKDTRDGNQKILLGQPGIPGEQGTGMIPGDLIIKTTPKAGVPNAIEFAYVKHVPTGGTSFVQFMSYDQGREAFQKVQRDVIWADEEVPDDIYTEMTMRILRNVGMIMLTYTPIKGLTPVTLAFMENAVNRKDLPIEITALDREEAAVASSIQ